MNELANTATTSLSAGRWGAPMKRLGACGFWFFLIKGLLWISAPYVVYAMSSLAGNAQ